MMPPRPFICLVNLAELDPPANGGVARIAWLVSDLLAEAASEQMRPVFLVRWGFAAAFAAWLGREAVTVPYVASPDARRMLHALRPDLIVSPLFGLRPFERAVTPHITQIPDTLALDHPEMFNPREAAGRASIVTSLPRARCVVTISQFSRRQLLQHTDLHDDQIRVVGLGSELTVAPLEDVSGLPERYVLYPANWWPHKRHGLLLDTMRRVWSREPGLKLALPGEIGPVERTTLAEFPPGAVVTPGRLSDGQLRTTYQRAEALMFTSFYEGFGMPVVEAMGEGCPVLCAPVAALPEVAGDAALFVDSDDPEAWATALLDALPGQRDELIRRGREQAGHFTWAAAREGWHNVLAEAGVPLLGTGSGPMPALAQAALLAELEQIRLRLDVNWHSDHEALRALPRLVRRPALMIRALRLQRRLLERSLP